MVSEEKPAGFTMLLVVSVSWSTVAEYVSELRHNLFSQFLEFKLGFVMFSTVIAVRFSILPS